MPQPRPPLVRTRDRRVVAGVAAGLGAHLGVDPILVRSAFVLLTLAGGIGVLLYLAAWVLVPPQPDGDPAPTPGRYEFDLVTVGALGAIVLGLLLLARSLGSWLGGSLAWAAALAGIGVLVLWARPDDTGDPDGSSALDRLPPAVAAAVTAIAGPGRAGIARVLAGIALVALGGVLLLTSVGSWDAVWDGFAAALVVMVGVTLVVGPGLWRLANALAEERRARIRSQERADVAAHLHDSVLQTLALVQRRADDPKEVVRLARRQERELRDWLLGGQDPRLPDGTSLGGALERVAAEVEEEYGVPVDVVRVRDCPFDDGLEPLLLATREALVNAARHSGAPVVSLYCEVEPQRATVWVRDRGCGFDPDTVGADRRGIAESIVGRVTRHGGIAEVHSAVDGGTEVELTMPRNAG